MQIKAKVEQATARKYPESVVLVTSCDRNGRPNVMAVGWCTTVSYAPRMFVCGIDDAALTYRNIKQTREFVIALPSEDMARETYFVGTHHGHKVDKFRETGLVTQPASRIQPPLIADAVANFECRLVAVYRPGDCPLLIGEVVAAHVNKNPRLKRLYHIDTKYRLAGLRVAGAGR